MLITRSTHNKNELIYQYVNTELFAFSEWTLRIESTTNYTKKFDLRRRGKLEKEIIGVDFVYHCISLFHITGLVRTLRISYHYSYISKA